MNYWFVFHFENSEWRHLLGMEVCSKVCHGQKKVNDCGYQYKVLLYMRLNWRWVRINHLEYESLDSCP